MLCVVLCVVFSVVFRGCPDGTFDRSRGRPRASPVIALAYACVETDECSLAPAPPPPTWGGVILGKNRHVPWGEIPVYIDHRMLHVSEALPDKRG